MSDVYYKIDVDEKEAYRIPAEDLEHGDVIMVRRNNGHIMKSTRGTHIFEVREIREREDRDPEVVVEGFEDTDQLPVSATEVNLIDDQALKEWMQFEGVGKKTAQNLLDELGPLKNVHESDVRAIGGITTIDGVGMKNSEDMNLYIHRNSS